MVAGVGALAGRLVPPDAPLWPSLARQSAANPWLAAAVEGLGVVSSIGIGLFVLHVLDRVTGAWTRRSWLAVAVIVALITTLVAARAGEAGGAVVGGVIAGFAAAAMLFCVLRFDPRTVPGYVVVSALVVAAENAALEGTRAGWTGFVDSDGGERHRRYRGDAIHRPAMGSGSHPAAGCLNRFRRVTAPSPASRLLAELAQAMTADAIPLAHRIERARHAHAPAAEWERIAAAVARSVARRRSRAARRPVIAFPPELPVAQRADDIARLIRAHQAVIVCGETGSGKTTQLPKICLAEGRGERGLIGHTQPRRIAARAVARTDRAGARNRAGNGRRLQGPLHRPYAPRRLRQADDRRHPARRDAGRPAARRIRHDHHRRGA